MTAFASYDNVRVQNDRGERRACARYDAIRQFVNDNRGSRLTVTRPNGSGKTTLATRLSFDLEFNYFNPKHRISLSGCDEKKLSDGQYSVSAIHEIGASDDANIILDEWNAFLDDSNRKLVESLILELLRKGGTVIEVIHNN